MVNVCAINDLADEASETPALVFKIDYYGDLQALAIGAGARFDLCMRGLIVNIYLHPAQRLRAAAAAHQSAGCKPA